MTYETCTCRDQQEPLKLYTRPEVAKMIKMSVRATIRLEQSGALQSVRVGRAVRFTKDAIDSFVKNLGKPVGSA